MNRRTLLILGIFLFLIVATMGVILYVRSKQNSANPAQTAQTTDQAQQTSSTTDSSTQESATGSSQNSQTIPLSAVGIQQISSTNAISPAIAINQQSVWWFSSSGHLYKASIDSGIKQEYGLPSFVPVQNVIWPQIGNDFIADSGSGSSPRFHYYDSDAKKFIDYPANIKSVDFLPDGRHVAYVWVSGNKANISMADFNASNFKSLVNLNNPNDVIKVSPDGKKIFAWDPTKPDNGALLYINVDTKKVVSIKTGASNAALWSPDSTKFVFFKADSSGDPSQLWLGDITTSKNDKPLNFTVSDLSKVTFDPTGNNLLVSVPVDGKNDSVWSVDLTTFEKKQLFANERSVNVQIKNILITNDGSKLFFVNSDGFLYSLDMTQQ